MGIPVHDGSPDERSPSYDELREENALLRRRVVELEGKVAELERLIGRNSGNSSKPPSADPPTERQRQAQARRERRAAKRKPGKQPGTEGKYLPMTETPDAVVASPAPDHCRNCGDDLAHGEELGEEVRQVFDVPRPVVQVTEYRVHKVRCRCGTVNTGTFPAEATAPTCYGRNVRSTVAYLMARQHLPYERTAEALRDLYGIEVSTGFLDRCYAEGASNLDGFVDTVKELLRAEPVVHVDETSDRVGTKSVWFHVVASERYTLLHADVTRGLNGVVRTGVLPGYEGIAVHDRLAQYDSYTDAEHAYCGAHLQRALASVETIVGQHVWSRQMSELLTEMHNAATTAREKGKLAIGRKRLAGFLEAYDEIVQWALLMNREPTDAKRNVLERESFNLAKAFSEHKTEITRFARDLRVPFSNNSAERPLRMVKIHRKVSGSFRSHEGAERLAAYRSYLSTAQKHSLSAFEVLARLFGGDPWIPLRA